MHMKCGLPKAATPPWQQSPQSSPGSGKRCTWRRGTVCNFNLNSPEGANAMVVYTMVEMAKAHGLHPYNYLKYLLDSRLGTDTTDAELKDLAPWSEKARIECNKKSE